MNEKNDLALVRKPSSAVEKAAPGAKRILSGMVADAHALVINKGRKKVRIVLVDDEPLCAEAQELMIKFLHIDAEVLKFDDGEHAWQEIMHTTPDLLITDMNRAGLSGWKMLPMLETKKATFPILVVSAMAEWGLKQFAESELNLTFLPKPIKFEEFQTALEAALKIPRATAKQDETACLKTSPLKIILVDDEESVLKAIGMVIRIKYKNARIQTFQDSKKAWQELLREDPDLLITRDRMPGLAGEEIVRRLVERNITYPIIVGGGWPPTEQWVRKYTDQNSKITFLSYPFAAEQLYERFSRFFGPSENPQT